MIEKWTESCLLSLENKEAKLLARISDLKRKGDEMILTCQISLKGVNSKNAYALRPSTKWDAKNVMSLTTVCPGENFGEKINKKIIFNTWLLFPFLSNRLESVS